jgi:hypothetical protein
MLKDIESVISKIKEKFSAFSNFIELDDFRQILLFTLTSQAANNLMSQLGIGGNPDIISLPYDPVNQAYYQKVNLISSGSLIIYTKSAPISDKFLLEKDEPIFHEFLNQNERDLAFRGKEKFLFPKLSDCSSIDDSKVTIKIDDLFHDFKSFISYSQPNVIFVIDSKDDKQADIVFTFNMMPQFPVKLDEKVLKIDIFMDEDHLTRGKIYLEREEDYELNFLNDMKEVSHSELYKSSFSLILHVKSFNAP